MKFKQFLTEGINDKGIFKAIIMAGTAGSGKSFVISKIKSGQIEPRIVNTDTWTEFLKAYGNEKWKEYQEKIKLLTTEQLMLYLNSMLPLWIDGTSANPPNTLKRTGILKSLGYDVGMVWVDTSLETSLKRAEKRERPVEPQFIKDMYKKIQGFKDYYKSEYKFFVSIKNDDGELTDKIILKAFRKTTGFFNSPVKNPIGQTKIEEMKKSGHKYLIDNDNYTMKDLKKLVTAWYRR